MRLRWFEVAAFCFVFCSCQSAGITQRAHIPKGEYVPFFDPEKKPISIQSFELDVFPVTQAQYLNFVKNNPSWSRSHIKRIFADADYLKNWKSDSEVQDKSGPVTYVSWFAAKAYCESQNERLPTTDEWEYVARASEKNEDGSFESENKEKILNWYGNPMPDKLPSVGKTERNFYGVFDMHGLVWEWVFDFKAIPKSDGRASGISLPQNLYCAGGVGLAADPTNYASFMRFAFRSSLNGTYTVKGLGFRCAKD